MSSIFNLHLGTGLGHNLDDAVRDGCRIAALIGLEYITFTGNDHHYTCYPNGTALRFGANIRAQPPRNVQMGWQELVALRGAGQYVAQRWRQIGGITRMARIELNERGFYPWEDEHQMKGPLAGVVCTCSPRCLHWPIVHRHNCPRVVSRESATDYYERMEALHAEMMKTESTDGL